MSLRLRSTVPSTDADSLRVVAVTAAILFLGGVATGYQSTLRDVLHGTGTLSPVQWVAFTVGPFLVEPVLLFGALYYVSSRRATSTSLAALVPGLVGAVVIGTLLGQHFGIQLGSISAVNDVPLMQARGHLLDRDPRVLAFWRVLVEPLAHDLLTAVAALALGRAVETT